MPEHNPFTGEHYELTAMLRGDPGWQLAYQDAVSNVFIRGAVEAAEPVPGP